MSSTTTNVGGSTSVEPDRDELWQRPLTVRTYNPHKDRSMRLEERYVSDGQPCSHVTQAVHKLRQYRREKAQMKMVFEDGTQPVSHRFNGVYANKKYAQAMDAARVLQRDFDDPWTIMLVLKAYPYNANGSGRAYADHLHDLISSNRPVIKSLQYHLTEKNGIEFGRLSVIQPHRTGYGHIHHGLICDGCPSPNDLQAVVDVHVSNCAIARAMDHEGGTISIQQNPTGLITELSKDLIGFDDNIESDDATVRRKYERLGATLMATNINQWRPDQSVFQKAIEQGQIEREADGGEDKGDYEGIQFEDGGAVYDPSELGGKGGGVTMLDVTQVDADDDPLPDVS